MLFRSDTLRLIPSSLPPVIFTAFGPSAGTNGVASSAFTVILYHATFNGSQTITISDGGNGGTITPSVGTSGTSTKTVTPAANTNSFAFTYTPATAGTISLTFTNAQGWTNQTPLTYTVSGSAFYTVTPPSPSSGTTAQMSGLFTVALNTGTFNGTQTITISDNGNGGMISPSYPTGGPSPATIHPAAGVSSFTFFYAPANPATVTLSFSNGQGWTDASPVTYVATGAAQDYAIGVGNIFQAQTWMYQNVSAAPLNSNSAAMTTNFISQVGGGFFLNTSNFAPAVYGVSSLVPDTYTIACDPSWSSCSISNISGQFWQTVPVVTSYMASSNPSSDSDHGVTLYQPGDGLYWEIWRWAGPPYTALPILGSFGIGNVTPATSNGVFGGYGQQASGIALQPGLITVSDLLSGSINHAIAIQMLTGSTTIYYQFSWPASRSDGNGSTIGTSPIPTGARGRIDPTLNLSTLGLTTFGLMVATAMQKYGFVVTDTAGAVTMRTENTLSWTQVGLTDPYSVPPLSTLFSPPNIFVNFPYSSFQWLPFNYDVAPSVLDMANGNGFVNSGQPATTPNVNEGWAFAGSLIVVAVWTFTDIGSTLVDNNGESYTKRNGTSPNAAGNGVEIWSKIITNANPSTWTLTTASAGGYFLLGAYVVNPNATSINGALDLHPAAVTGSGTSFSAASGVPAQATEVLFAVTALGAQPTANSWVEDPAWTSQISPPASAFSYGSFNVASKIITTAASNNYGPSWTGSETYACAIASFEFSSTSTTINPNTNSSGGGNLFATYNVANGNGPVGTDGPYWSCVGAWNTNTGSFSATFAGGSKTVNFATPNNLGVATALTLGSVIGGTVYSTGTLTTQWPTITSIGTTNFQISANALTSGTDTSTEVSLIFAPALATPTYGEYNIFINNFPATFPNGTILNWVLPPTPNDFNVYCYPCLNYGNALNDSPAAHPVSALVASAVSTMAINVNMTVSGTLADFDIMAECWSGTTPTNALNSSTATNEISFFFHTPSYLATYITGLGNGWAFNTGSNHFYIARTGSSPPQICIMPVTSSGGTTPLDMISGNVVMPCAAIIQALIGHGWLTSTDYLVGMEMGVEPQQGAGSLTFNTFSMTWG